MDTHSVKSTKGLPQEGEPVEFLLKGRGIALIGTYVEHTFRSRYSDYEVERVSSWRSARENSGDTRGDSLTNSRCI